MPLTTAQIDAFTHRVSDLLSDPDRLGGLFTALGIAAQHYPTSGSFNGECPFCKSSDGFHARYKDTESSPYKVFWTCRNEKCKSKCRHSSVLGLVREALRLDLKEAIRWLADHLGYENPEDILASPAATPTKKAVVVGHIAKVAQFARKGYAVFYAPKNKIGELKYHVLLQFAELGVDSSILDDLIRWSAEQAGSSEATHKPSVSRVTVETPPIQYKPIKNNRGYSIGSDGTILKQNQHTGTWSVGEPKATKDGHPYVALKGKGEPFKHRVAKLVLNAFVGPAPRPGLVPVHRDGDPKNNAVANLQWGEKPKKDNKGERHGRSKLTEADVVEMILLHRQGTTMTRLAELKGVDVSNVSNIVRRKTWKHVTIPSES